MKSKKNRKRKGKKKKGDLKSIKAWPKSERPREILLEEGPSFLSDAGLIAVLLRSGTKGKDAVALARQLIKRFKGIRGLLSANKSDLKEIKGLGDAKIAQLLAALELSKRILQENIIGKNYLKNKKDVIDYLSLSMMDLKREFFKVIYVNKSNIVLAVEDIAKGTVDQAVIYPREIIKKALELNASGVIFVHNHPSGDNKPSKYDIEITQKLASACNAVDITPLDHIIILPDGYISLKEKGII